MSDSTVAVPTMIGGVEENMAGRGRLLSRGNGAAWTLFVPDYKRLSRDKWYNILRSKYKKIPFYFFFFKKKKKKKEKEEEEKQIREKI